MLERSYDSYGVGQCSGVCAVTNVLPRWGNAWIAWWGLHCYNDFTPLGNDFGNMNALATPKCAGQHINCFAIV